MTIAASGTDHMILDGSEVLVKRKLKVSGAQVLQVRETVFESVSDNEFKINVLDASGEIDLQINGTSEVFVDSSGLSASAITLADASGIAGNGVENALAHFELNYLVLLDLL